MTAGKLLVAQSGGPTPVINASLYGVVDEVLRHDRVGGVLGALHGIEGVLGEQLVDLGRETPENLARLRETPSAILGSCRYKMRDQDLEQVLEVFRRHEVRWFVYIGGNDSADTADRIAGAARHAAYELAVMGVPKTIDNDLPVTDHCPGYGSAARFVALATAGAGRDTEAMRRTDPVKIVEVMGRYAGWLAAASALMKRDVRDAPQMVLVPERPLEAEQILEAVQAIHRQLGYAVLVLCENQADPTGRVLGAEGEPRHIDAFGHTYFDSPGEYLARRIGDELGLRARHDRPGSIQRMMAAVSSRVDREEAEAVGREAVRRACGGESGQMVVLLRADGAPYCCTLGVAPLAEIANQQKLLPHHFWDRDTLLPTPAFHDYALPLLGDDLPEYARLSGVATG